MRMIDADSLKNILPTFANVIDEQPTIDAEPVRHGRWIMLEPYGTHHTHRRKCSVCGEIKSKELTNFCPNCGAKMDLRTPTQAALDMADSVMMGGVENDR